jgi:stage II sporulation protein AA (anti-sigma F factor antagonist)
MLEDSHATRRSNGRPQMKIKQETTGANVLVLIPEGRLDSNTVAEAESDLLARIEPGDRRVVLDLAGLDYISSAGLRLVLLAAKRLKQAGGRLALCGLRPQIREVFEISGFVSILTVVGSRQEAEAAVAG